MTQIAIWNCAEFRLGNPMRTLILTILITPVIIIALACLIVGDLVAGKSLNYH